MNIKLKDERLAKRWRKLVHSQMKAASRLAAGAGGLASNKAFAATQAAWRFYNNERITLVELIAPLRDFARDQVAMSKAHFVLVAHDWSKLSYPGHEFREDLAELSNDTDFGYEITMSLAISPEDGAPLAPVEMHMKTKDAFLSTRDPSPGDMTHLDQILPTMQASQAWNLGKPLVHVIDREADSVGHYRDWDAGGHKVLIRADDRKVLWGERRAKLSEIRQELHQQGAYQDVGPALYHGRKARLQVTETTVILDRPARKVINGKKLNVPGPPLTMRLILTRVVDEKGNLLAEWYLLSNVPIEWADAAMLARCYYWRWRIESYFKLMKSHGFQVEYWLQETGLAIARRMLVASMAAVTAWQLMADESAPATELKTVLIRLSGRQMKRNRPFTPPALLAGLWTLLSMLDTLEHYDAAALKTLIAQVQLPIPLLESG
jgi:hypothetical protein